MSQEKARSLYLILNTQSNLRLQFFGWAGAGEAHLFEAAAAQLPGIHPLGPFAGPAEARRVTKIPNG